MKPSRGDPTSQDEIDAGTYTRDYLFSMWGEELFLEEPWLEEIREWIYDPSHDTPICQFNQVNDIGYFNLLIINFIVFLQSLYLLNYFR